ncbi:hypothetical protein MCC02031_07260 [Bifidobacteriaceae bacterium MCC02031]|nr:hypothetical protein MCC02031_07260 [Bifidobacteriaceae bacterium MCC02031]
MDRHHLPVCMLHQDGGTWHLLIPDTFVGMVVDRANRYAARFTADALAEAFGRPEQRIEPLSRSSQATGMRYMASPARRRYRRVQARKLDKLKMMVDGSNAACRIQREAGGNLAKGLRDSE